MSIHGISKWFMLKWQMVINLAKLNVGIKYRYYTQNLLSYHF